MSRPLPVPRRVGSRNGGSKGAKREYVVVSTSSPHSDTLNLDSMQFERVLTKLCRKYVPQPPEPVLGIIIARHAEGYRVDIGSSQAASLDALAFEGATKRSKPNLKVRRPTILRSFLHHLLRSLSLCVCPRSYD